jgi:hypothetical protein
MGAAQGQSLFAQSGKPVCLLQTVSRSILNPCPLRVNPEICQQQHLATVIWHIRRGTCLFIAIVPPKKRFAARRARQRSLFAEVEWAYALWQFPYPDISEADGLALVAVCLQFDGCAIVLLVVGLADKQSLTDELKVILNQHAI